MMGNTVKKKMERALANNQKANKMALQMKKSWNEVSAMLEKKKK